MTTLKTSPARFLMLALGLVLFAATGCSSNNDPTGPGSGGQTASTQDGDLQLTVTTDKASYLAGDPVTITITLTNTGSAPVNLDFARGTPARYSNLNINVDDSDGADHYAQGDGTLDKTALAPKASYRYSFTWNQVSRLTRKPVDRGFFEIIGFAGFDDRDYLRVDGLFVELK